MIQRLLVAAILIGGSSAASAQSVDDLNIQIHGYVTQGFVYTNHNNWNTLESTDGSPAWSEAVLNVSAQPDSHLHIGLQGRYSLLGSLSNEITLDWAQVDYKFNQQFAVRAGKVKTSLGLYNETQDIDPALMWILLPQSIYPIASRNSSLSVYGGAAYGTVRVGEHFGKLQYQAYGGERVIAANDGYFQSLRDEGLTSVNGVSGKTGGGSLRWHTPARGLLIGAGESSGGLSGAVMAGPYSADLSLRNYRQTLYFADYDRGKFSFSLEASRQQVQAAIQFPGRPPATIGVDNRAYYVMGSYRVTGKLSGGLYFSSVVDHKAAFTSGRYAKDWAVAGRYDFNAFIYAKAEQHWIDGNDLAFYAADNTNLHPNTKMTLLKIGVNF